MLHRPSSNTAITVRNLMISIWIMLVLLVVISLFIEHSMIDLSLARSAYQGDGQWLIDKQNTALFIIFYTAPKYLLIALEIYIIAAYLVRKLKRRFGVFYPCRHLSTHSLAYLSLALVSTPLVVGIAKAVTHVACPVSLDVFGGDLPYVSLIQSMILGLPAKCFPAAHASVGFALYAFAFVPEFSHHRKKIILIVTMLGFVMGGYKMLIGDHFFSHTLASLCTAWLIAGSLALLFFHRSGSMT
jgi:membrane-associated PAP2 superfamily phosphatase